MTLGNEPKFCTECGAAMQPSNKFCAGCGRRLNRELDENINQPLQNYGNRNLPNSNKPESFSDITIEQDILEAESLTSTGIKRPTLTKNREEFEWWVSALFVPFIIWLFWDEIKLWILLIWDYIF
jgi:hypothetical protein